MKVNVLLFAQARQIAGSDKLEVEIEKGSSVGDLRLAISGAYPALSDLLGRSSIALDQQYSVDSDLVPENSEVAMIPPVSGG